MSQNDFSKLAYAIRELANKCPIRRSSIYNQIAAGRLRARKIGRRTIVLGEDWPSFLASTPLIASSENVGEPGILLGPRGGVAGHPRSPENGRTHPVKSTTTAVRVPAPRAPDESGAGS